MDSCRWQRTCRRGTPAGAMLVIGRDLISRVTDPGWTTLRAEEQATGRLLPRVPGLHGLEDPRRRKRAKAHLASGDGQRCGGSCLLLYDAHWGVCCRGGVVCLCVPHAGCVAVWAVGVVSPVAEDWGWWAGWGARHPLGLCLLFLFAAVFGFGGVVFGASGWCDGGVLVYFEAVLGG
jgi:hypothetical protein